MKVQVVFDHDEDWTRHGHLLKECDVAMEFTTPDAAPANVQKLLHAGIHVVSGTTGWNASIEDAASLAQKKNLGLMVASNFSIGMNLLFALNKSLARWMKDFPEYRAAIEETHHVQKLDAPSGTAITLAKGLIGEHSQYNHWTSESQPSNDHLLPVTSFREGMVVGIHKVYYQGPSDSITLKHEALNRDGFVQGALAAARWIIGRKGLCTMEDMLFGESSVYNSRF